MPKHAKLVRMIESKLQRPSRCSAGTRPKTLQNPGEKYWTKASVIVEAAIRGSSAAFFNSKRSPEYEILDAEYAECLPMKDVTLHLICTNHIVAFRAIRALTWYLEALAQKSLSTFSLTSQA